MSDVREDVREVSFEEALAEENDQAVDEGTDQAAPRPRPGRSDDSEKPVADLDLFVSKVEPKEWTFGQGDVQRSYVQRELSVIGKTQWFSLVGEILDKSLGGENGLSLNSLMTPPTPRTSGAPLAPTDFQDADTFVHAVGKLMVYAPEFLSKSVCIWLAVPDYEWELVRELMKLSPAEGGMDDDTFEGIFELFIDQNYPAINRFFRERFPRLRGRWQARQSEANQSRSQKR